jgi:predicted DNA-binding transcriptional regulator YafY
MPRNRQVVHQWQILKALMAGPQTVAQLAALAECTTRNVYRHIEALEEAGFPLYSDQDEDGAKRWRLAGRIAVPERRAA